MTNLNDLPYEILVILFKYLDLNVLLKLRLINKKFKNIIEKQRITGLQIGNGQPNDGCRFAVSCFAIYFIYDK